MAQRKYHGMQVDPSQRTKAAEQTHAELLVLVDDLDLTDPVQDVEAQGAVSMYNYSTGQYENVSLWDVV